MQSSNSFTIPHYRMKATNSYWTIVFMYKATIEKWFVSNGYELDEIEVEEEDTYCHDGESINIRYNNNNYDINIHITLFTSNMNNSISFTENTLILDTILRKNFCQMLQETKDQILNDHQEEEDEIEKEFQEECGIDYAMYTD